jgi:hypothetical protein
MLEEMKVKELMQLIQMLQGNKPDHGSWEIKGGIYVIVRTYSAGVFAGNWHSQRSLEVNLQNARRLWKWSGAASLSQLAVDGVKNPGDCMFPCEVPSIYLLQAIEIIPCSEKAKESIKSVKNWEA